MKSTNNRPLAVIVLIGWIAAGWWVGHDNRPVTSETVGYIFVFVGVVMAGLLWTRQ